MAISILLIKIIDYWLELLVERYYIWKSIKRRSNCYGVSNKTQKERLIVLLKSKMGLLSLGMNVLKCGIKDSSFWVDKQSLIRSLHHIILHKNNLYSMERVVDKLYKDTITKR